MRSLGRAYVSVRLKYLVSAAPCSWCVGLSDTNSLQNPHTPDSLVRSARRLTAQSPATQRTHCRCAQQCDGALAWHACCDTADDDSSTHSQGQVSRHVQSQAALSHPSRGDLPRGSGSTPLRAGDTPDNSEVASGRQLALAAVTLGSRGFDADPAAWMSTTAGSTWVGCAL